MDFIVDDSFFEDHISVAADEQCLHIGFHLDDLVVDLPAVFLRHHQIEDEHIDMGSLIELPESIRPVNGLDGLIARHRG